MQSKGQSEFIKALGRYRYKFNVYELFSDFCQCAACAINSPIENHIKREAQYQAILKRYGDDRSAVAQFFGELFGLLIEILEEEPLTDVLGQIYMNLEIADKKHLGQCFTPGSVSELCGNLTFNVDIQAEIAAKHFVSLNDCCVGGGSMVLAFAKAMKAAGFNPQKELCVVCNDIDQLCVNMAYIQLSLNGIPAIVLRGNTITQEFIDQMHTPFWVCNDNYFKFERWYRKGE